MITMEQMNKKYFLKKGTKGRLSSLGYYGYWYPGVGEKYDTSILEDKDAEHLSLWKNQDPYFAFKIEAKYVKLKVDLKSEDLVCVWIHKDNLI